jgi:hypothetical protein
MRGHCTGPIQIGHQDAQVDDVGRVYLPSYAYLGDPATDEDLRFYTCPEGQVRGTLSLMRLYRQHRDGTVPLDKALVQPSVAAVAIIEAFRESEADIRWAEHEERIRALKERGGGGG